MSPVSIKCVNQLTTTCRLPVPCRINMSMPGLPPLPKSLSGFELAAVQQQLQYGLTAIQEQAAAAAAATTAQGSGKHSQQQQSQGAADSVTSSSQPQNVSPLPRKSSTLDTQLSILRREMVRMESFDKDLLILLYGNDLFILLTC